MMDVWKSTRVVRIHSNWDGNKTKMHLSCPIGMTEVLEASFDLKNRFSQPNLLPLGI